MSVEYKTQIELQQQLEEVIFKLHTHNRQEQIHQHLTDKSLSTSIYTFMEFRRSILQAYAYVNFLLSGLARAGHSEINLSTLLIQLSEARGVSRSPRTIQRLMLVAADIVEQFGNDIVPIQLVCDYLSMQIGGLVQDFFAGIDELSTSPIAI